ncbi:MAG: hypothetical protein ABIJ16_12435, partial [Bacteroidota bacterium]
GSMEKLSINTAKVAVASKDLSDVTINDIRITDCDFGLVVFCKKKNYGPASVIVNELQIRDVKEVFLIEPGCAVMVSGKKITEAKYPGIGTLLYTGKN